ncbi:uncharacterized protein BDR25DRAFT_352716 [Lindgomyces ingoldianus]|uniref:Uncharacterized protein n=1 Tax=Lindgomyces ingoldianus TaxID=673940 RepID=A0ACB6R451_9PLEO|nr:uncharacterized protein BDR25DRAFT_352716 [Lindgomyces ingoldianus]KAF2473292.1 hypothetical protein BDR25DRAFT_352716 [Lindgomyces ingoldianus]
MNRNNGRPTFSQGQRKSGSTKDFGRLTPEKAILGTYEIAPSQKSNGRSRRSEGRGINSGDHASQVRRGQLQSLKQILPAGALHGWGNDDVPSELRNEPWKFNTFDDLQERLENNLVLGRAWIWIGKKCPKHDMSEQEGKVEIQKAIQRMDESLTKFYETIFFYHMKYPISFTIYHDNLRWSLTPYFLLEEITRTSIDFGLEPFRGYPAYLLHCVKSCLSYEWLLDPRLPTHMVPHILHSTLLTTSIMDALNISCILPNYKFNNMAPNKP